MSATTFTTTNTTNTTDVVGSNTTTRTRFWRAGLASGAVASLATSLMVVVARAADVDVAIDGEQIPLAGFAQFTMIGALIGIALAKVFSRRARSPHTTFVRTTVALTALSIVPDLMVPATTVGSRLVLALTHVVAAAIIVPVLAARLHD